VSVWNMQPAQNDYTVQSGRVSFGASSAGAWPTSNGVLAEFVFQVQAGQTAQYRWPIHLSRTELTADGYDVRALADSEIYFIGRNPNPPSIGVSALRRAADGLHLSLVGEAGVAYTVETSTNLVDWAPLTTVTVGDGVLNFTDPSTTGSGRRFYRAKQQ
jgi:hypothetical protein